MSSGGLSAATAESTDVADIPDQIVLKRHRELESLGFNRPVRYGILLAVGALLVAGLANVFGQHPDTKHAESDAASLQLYAPSHLRGGLLYEARFTIVAKHEVKNALLEFETGWNEGMQINTIEPSPLGEASRNGEMLFT